MTTTTLVEEELQLRRPPLGWRVLRWTTLALCLVTILVLALAGVRQAPYATLEDGLRSGTVDEVTIRSYLPDLEQPVVGVSSVRLEWRDGWQRRSATIWNASSEAALAEQPAPTDSDISGVVVGNLSDELRALDPDLTLTRGDPPSSWGTLGHWDLFSPWAVLPGLLWFLTMLTMLAGPEPRWATRWAWTWLLLSPAVFVAVPAYLILGARGHDHGWRLTGGWAFLIFLLISGRS